MRGVYFLRVMGTFEFFKKLFSQMRKNRKVYKLFKIPYITRDRRQIADERHTEYSANLPSFVAYFYQFGILTLFQIILYSESRLSHNAWSVTMRPSVYVSGTHKSNYATHGKRHWF